MTRINSQVAQLLHLGFGVEEIARRLRITLDEVRRILAELER